MLIFAFLNSCDSWMHPTRSFFCPYAFSSLILSIHTTSAVKKYPTPIFILPRFSSFLSLIILSTGMMLVDLGGEGSDFCFNQRVHWWMILCVWNVIPTKNKSQQKTSGFWEVITSISENQIAQDLKPRNYWQISNNEIYLKSKMYL